MRPIVYIDVLFFINFIFNMLIFFITSFLLKKEVKAKRIITAGIFSALYASLMFFPKISFLYSYAVKIIFTVLLTWFLFLPKTIKDIIKQSLVLMFVSFALGGTIFALVFLFEKEKYFSAVFSGGIIYLDIDILVLALGAIISIIILLFFSVFNTENAVSDQIKELYIYKGNKNIKVKAFLDTGCLLMDKDGNTPALIVEKEIFENQIFFECKKHTINYSTITNEYEETEAFYPDFITDKNKKNIYSVVVVKGTENFDEQKRFNALLNPKIFNQKTGSENYEKII